MNPILRVCEVYDPDARINIYMIYDYRQRKYINAHYNTRDDAVKAMARVLVESEDYETFKDSESL